MGHNGLSKTLLILVCKKIEWVNKILIGITTINEDPLYIPGISYQAL